MGCEPATRCCGCMDVKTGVYVIAVVAFVSALIGAIYAVDTFDLITAIISMGMAGVGIYAASKVHYRAARLYMIWNAIDVVLSFLMVILMLTDKKGFMDVCVKGCEENPQVEDASQCSDVCDMSFSTTIVISLLSIALGAYFVYAMWSFAENIRRGMYGGRQTAVVVVSQTGPPQGQQQVYQQGSAPPQYVAYAAPK